MRLGFAGLVIGAVLVLPTATSRSDEPGPFALQELPSRGRTVAAELVELDGDGRCDLLQLAFVGYPPNETRWIRVFLQSPSGALPGQPTHTWPLPPGTAAYDVADVSPEPGEELILLRAAGLTVLSLGARELVRRDLAVPRPPTLGTAEDERGLDRLAIAHRELGPRPWLLVPGPGHTVALSPDGERLADLEVGNRANYLVPRPGPLVFESELQAFIDAPRLSIADVDGDGRRDVVASSRHYLRLFLQRPDGRFGTEPDRVLPLARISERDHIRASGAVRVDVRDIDDDGRADLLVSHQSGALTDAHTRTDVHLNRGGGWELARPDERFESRGAWTTDQLLDVDGDGLTELVRVEIPFSILEIVEVLVTRELDARISIHRRQEGGGFAPEPWLRKKIGVPLDFDTFRTAGFIPTLQFDLNGDGWRDLLTSASGDALEVYPGGAENPFGERAARVAADTRGRVRPGDLDGDGLTDLVLYDPIRPDAPVLVVRNNGMLPGTRDGVRLRPVEE